MPQKKNNASKSYLLRIGYLDAQINAKLDDIDSLRAMATRITATLKADVVSCGGPGDKIGNAVAKIVDLSRDIDARVDQFVDAKREASALLEKLESQPHYDVLHKRYMLGMAWEDIAAEMGYSMSGIFNLHGEALQRFGKILRNAEKE